MTTEVPKGVPGITIDTVEINSLVAARPDRLFAVLERETQNGLWQLTLSDPETRNVWRLGYYIDHYETREVELQDELQQERPEWPHASDVIAWVGRRISIRANGDRIHVEVGTWRLEYPRLCPPATRAPGTHVYIGTTSEGRYFVLDCAGGKRAYPVSLEGLECEVELKACCCDGSHRLAWHVVRGGEVVEVVETSRGPRAVIEVLRRELGP
jgi:hypothetical protein